MYADDQTETTTPEGQGNLFPTDKAEQLRRLAVLQRDLQATDVEIARIGKANADLKKLRRKLSVERDELLIGVRQLELGDKMTKEEQELWDAALGKVRKQPKADKPAKDASAGDKAAEPKKTKTKSHARKGKKGSRA